MKTWQLATIMLRRGLRTRELRLLLTALLLAAAATSSILIATDRMDRAMLSRAAELMGADLAMHSSREVDAALLEAAGRYGLRHARALEFASMVSAGGDMQLASVKAVDGGFPLRGRLQVADGPHAEGVDVAGGPPRGEVWLESRLFGGLDVAVGEHIRVGHSELLVSRALLYEPGRGGDFYSLAPRVLMSLDDVPATGVVQPGSRLGWRYQFAGTPEQIQAYARWLRPKLSASAHLHDPRDPDSGSGAALRNTERFLGLAVLAAVVLSGVAIAVSASLYAGKQFDCVALMRCFGARAAQVQRLYWIQFLLLGLIASVLGSLFGLALHEVLLVLLQGLLPARLPPVSLLGLLPGMALGPVLLLGFAMPVLAGLGRVPVLRILRADLPAGRLPVVLLLLPALLVTALVTAWFVGETRLTMLALGGFALLAGALLALGYGLMHLVALRGNGPGVVRRLLRRPLSNLGLLSGLALAVMAMSVVAILRVDLLSTWSSQLPERAPNQFAVNVFAEEVDALSEFLRAGGVEVEPFFPIVRGRLVTIDGESVREVVSKERNVRAINRELNLTWSAQLPAGNELEQGAWFGGETANEVSVESLLAARLGIEVGQRLGFQIGSETLEVTVTSIRTVDWNSFRPNFYMIFPPAVLDRFPVTLITSFYLDPGDKSLLNELHRRFPSVTLLDMAQIIGQVRSLVDQVSVAIEFILSYVLAAGLLVLAAAVAASLPARRREAAIVRALGGTRARIRRQLLEEFALLGGLAGVSGMIGAELLTMLLYRELLELPWAPQVWFWLLVPPGCALLVAAAGWAGARETVTTPPVEVLRSI